MSIRQGINEKPVVGVFIGVAALAIGVGIVIYEMRGNAPSPITKAYFTDDNGATYFADSVLNVPPYTDARGKTAYGADVYSYDKGTFVGAMERYQPWAKKQLEDLYAAAKEKGGSLDDVAHSPALDQIQKRGLEVKRPGDSKWEPSQSAIWMRQLTSPDGSPIENVFP